LRQLVSADALIHQRLTGVDKHEDGQQNGHTGQENARKGGADRGEHVQLRETRVTDGRAREVWRRLREQQCGGWRHPWPSRPDTLLFVRLTNNQEDEQGQGERAVEVLDGHPVEPLAPGAASPHGAAEQAQRAVEKQGQRHAPHAATEPWYRWTLVRIRSRWKTQLSHWIRTLTLSSPMIIPASP